jgi:hypothetical protein
LPPVDLILQAPLLVFPDIPSACAGLGLTALPPLGLATVREYGHGFFASCSGGGRGTQACGPGCPLRLARDGGGDSGAQGGDASGPGRRVGTWPGAPPGPVDGPAGQSLCPCTALRVVDVAGGLGPGELGVFHVHRPAPPRPLSPPMPLSPPRAWPHPGCTCPGRALRLVGYFRTGRAVGLFARVAWWLAAAGGALARATAPGPASTPGCPCTVCRAPCVCQPHAQVDLWWDFGYGGVEALGRELERAGAGRAHTLVEAAPRDGGAPGDGDAPSPGHMVFVGHDVGGGGASLRAFRGLLAASDCAVVSGDQSFNEVCPAHACVQLWELWPGCLPHSPDSGG